jgi:hypothetical protein
LTDPRLTLPADKSDRQDTRYVQSAYAPLFQVPDDQTSQLCELVHGQAFHVHHVHQGWMLGQLVPLISGSERPGYVGWVPSDAFEPRRPCSPTHYVCVLSAPVFSQPDLKSPIVQSLPLGSQIAEEGLTGSYQQIGAGRWLHQRHVCPITTPQSDFVNVARLYLGQPYVWGGNGARGVDCSGLVQMSLAACGIDAPRDADLQEQSLGEAIPEIDQDNLSRGDLLFWAGHVAIVSAKNRLLHANATHMGVVEEALDKALDRMNGQGLPLRTVRRL